MGAVIDTNLNLPLVQNAVTSYFEPALWCYSFLKNYSRKGSASKAIIESEVRKVKSSSIGKSWPSIRKSIDLIAHDSTHRALLRQARINWIVSSHNKDYLTIFNEIHDKNRVIADISKELFFHNIVDLQSAIDKSTKELTYNILIIDEVHRALAEENIRIYSEIFKSTKVLLLVFTATQIIKAMGKDDDYLNFTNFERVADKGVASKAIELKIEEFLSSMSRLKIQSTGH